MPIHKSNAAPTNLPSPPLSGIRLMPPPAGEFPLRSGSGDALTSIMSVPDRPFPICSICNKRVDLAAASGNELGMPIHEECHSLRDRLKEATAAATATGELEATDNPLVREIVKLLISAQNASPTRACPTCGSNLEYGHSIFIYRGRRWEIPLPICAQCYRETSPKAEANRIVNPMTLSNDLI